MPQLIEYTDLPEFGARIGFVFINGAGFRIGTETVGDGFQRHLSIAAARRLANTYEQTAQAEELKPVIEALRQKADRLEAWSSGDTADLPEVLGTARMEGHA